MDYLVEFQHGLGAIRAFMDKNFPDWKTAEVSVSLEPHHARMELNSISVDQKMESFEIMLVVGTFEDIDLTKEPAVPIEPIEPIEPTEPFMTEAHRQRLTRQILRISKRMEDLVDASFTSPDPEVRKNCNAKSDEFAGKLLCKMTNDLQFKAVYNELLAEGKLSLQYLKGLDYHSLMEGSK